MLARSFTSTASRLFLRLRYSDIPTTDPFNADFDGDKVGNYDELWMGTDPLLSVDSDSDGLPDDWEVAHGLNPNDAADAASDGDGDGLTNHGEFTAGTDPANPDTDGDGFSDSSETATGSSPLDSSSYVIRFRHISRGANAFDYVQQQFTEEDLGRPVQDGDHGWIEDNRSWLPLQEPIRTYLLDAFSVSALRPSIAFPPAPPADAWTWNPQLSPSSPGAGCAAPVWSNDDIGTVQERRYWLVRDYPSAVPISYTVLEVSRRVKNDNPPVIEVNPPRATRAPDRRYS